MVEDGPVKSEANVEDTNQVLFVEEAKAREREVLYEHA